MPSQNITIKNLSSQENSIIRRVDLDLNAPATEPTLVGPDDGTWQVNCKSKGLFSGNNGTIWVKITDKDFPPELAVDPGSHEGLLSIAADGYIFHKMEDGIRCEITRTNGNSEFQLLLNSRSIIDSSKPYMPGQDSMPFTFTVQISKDGDSITVPVMLKLHLAPISVEPQIKVELVHPNIVKDPKTGESRLKYDRKQQKEHIADIVVSNPSGLSYCPALKATVDTRITIGGNVPPAGLFTVKSDLAKYPNDVTFKSDKDKPGSFSVSSLRCRQQVRVPVFIDFGKMDNPKTDIDVDITAELDHCDLLTAKLILTPDPAIPTLNVEIEDPIGKTRADITDTKRTVLGKVDFLPGQGFIFRVPVTIRNTASEAAPGAALVLKDVKCDMAFSRSATVVAVNPEISQNDIIFAETAPANDSAVVPNASEKEFKIYLTFNPDTILDLYTGSGAQRDYNVNISARISFSYCIDSDGMCATDDEYFPAHRHIYTSEITIPVYQRPNPEWLAIDFGTSAIVAQYADMTIDLHQTKKDLLGDTDDDYEKDTKFLSSNLIFRNINNALPTQLLTQLQRSTVPPFDKLAVFLSPTSTIEYANASLAVPCLKLIVGYDLLPNIANYKDLRYNYTGRDGMPRHQSPMVTTLTNDYGQSVESYTPLARVDTIFSEVYKQLLTYFISPNLSGPNKSINQMILTVPNTYSPAHLQRIRQMVNDVLADTSLRNVQFVSESDAVACFYIKHWDRFNSDANRATLSQLKKRETVVVYDMGAGTLDLTLFLKETTSEGVSLTVLGRMGISKSGNFLDCKIAEVLSNIKGLEGLRKFADPDSINSGDRLKAALRLKNLIKNEIKPLLSQGNDKYVFKKDPILGVREDVEISIREDIKNTVQFKKEFLIDVTYSLLRNFIIFFQSQKDSTGKSPVGKVKIDTIIFSGRGSKLMALKKNIENFFSMGGPLCQYASADFTAVDIDTLSDPATNTEMAKSVVVEGAIEYARNYGGAKSGHKFISDNILANYGVIYEDENGNTKYEEMLNPRKLTPTGQILVEGRTIKTYTTPEVTLDLSHTHQLKLVQTFSSDTLRDWDNKQREYITLISEVDATLLPDRKNVRLQIVVDESNTMQLHINGMVRPGITTSKVDLDSITTKYSLWPMLYMK